MGIHRKGRHIKCLRHDHRCGLVPHARQGLQSRKCIRHSSTILLHQDPGHLMNIPGLGRRKTARLDDLAYDLNIQPGHCPWIIRFLKKERSDLVDFDIRASCRKYHGHKECIRIFMLQRNRHLRIQTIKDPGNSFGLLFFRNTHLSYSYKSVKKAIVSTPSAY